MTPSPPSTSQKQKFGVSLAARLALVMAMTILLLIATIPILALIHDRSRRQMEAVDEVSSKWAHAQTVTGPVLSVPYIVEEIVFDKVRNRDVAVASQRFAHFLPDKLKITGQVTPEIRRRGLFKAVVYQTRLTVTGEFAKPVLDGLGGAQGALWDKAVLTLGLTDMRGFQKGESFAWRGGTLTFRPGLPTTDVVSSGVTADRVFAAEPREASPFSMELTVSGSSGLYFTPLGRVTDVTLESPWPNPSFGGAFLPDDRSVSEQGFRAVWNVLDINRNYPQAFTGRTEALGTSVFGVDLMSPRGVYQSNTRAVKYAILFIGLTFMVFFMTEALTALRVHPVQYGLVGLALCLFYVLLLSFSEYIPFNAAYVLAALAVTGLITGYVNAALGDRRVTAALGGVLASLYGFLLFVLQLQDYALLAGALFLFAVLAAAMYFSRRIDWYALEKAG